MKGMHTSYGRGLRELRRFELECEKRLASKYGADFVKELAEQRNKTSHATERFEWNLNGSNAAISLVYGHQAANAVLNADRK